METCDFSVFFWLSSSKRVLIKRPNSLGNNQAALDVMPATPLSFKLINIGGVYDREVLEAPRCTQLYGGHLGPVLQQMKLLFNEVLNGWHFCLKSELTHHWNRQPQSCQAADISGLFWGLLAYLPWKKEIFEKEGERGKQKCFSGSTKKKQTRIKCIFKTHGIFSMHTWQDSHGWEEHQTVNPISIVTHIIDGFDSS